MERARGGKGTEGKRKEGVEGDLKLREIGGI